MRIYRQPTTKSPRRRIALGTVAATAGIAFLIAVIALDRVGAIDVLPDLFATIAMWVVFAYFVLGIVLNAASRSKAERAVMVPVTIVLAVLSFAIAMGGS